MKTIVTLIILASVALNQAQAALTVDRSRLIFNEGEKSISINVTNHSQQAPYLAQSWLENAQEQKITGPLMALPPVQRLEADNQSKVRIQSMPGISALPADRESVFYFNLREIPPKVNKTNVLTLAMQTRMKVFYRPKSLIVDRMADVVPGSETLTLERSGDSVVVKNPTPYYFTFVAVRNGLAGKDIDKFEPAMVEPKGQLKLDVTQALDGNSPVLIFVNDFGGQRLLPFTCSGNQCKADKVVIPQKLKSAGKS